jgi:hypothetical protein
MIYTTTCCFIHWKKKLTVGYYQPTIIVVEKLTDNFEKNSIIAENSIFNGYSDYLSKMNWTKNWKWVLFFSVLILIIERKCLCLHNSGCHLVYSYNWIYVFILCGCLCNI